MGCHWSRHCFSSELIGPQRRTPFACSIRQAGRWRRSRSRTPRQDSLNSWLGLGELGSDPEAVPIAIARRDGRLVDALLDAGHPVVPVKPTAIKAWRESEVPSGAKSDGRRRGNRGVPAAQGPRLRPAVPYSEETKAFAHGVSYPAPTSSPRVWRRPTSSPRYSTRTGLAPRKFSPTSPVRSVWRSWRATRCSASAANLGVKWITSTQSGFLHEPCCGLSGAAGAPALPTTVRFTTARRNTSPRRKRPEFAAKGGYRGCDGTTGLP